MKHLIMTLCLTLVCSAQAMAIDLDTAKARGLVGEANSGFLAYVVKPPQADTMALVKSVNRKRRTLFNKSASRNGITATQVANRFYERAVKATKSGHFYQTAGGDWVKK